MSLTLSKEHGVNPSVSCCEVCGAEIGVVLFGASYKDQNGKTAEAPHKVAMGLCDNCKNVLKVGGCLIIEVRDGETGNNPYRTGRVIGISEEAKNRIFKDADTTKIAYMEQTLFTQLFNDVIPKGSN